MLNLLIPIELILIHAVASQIVLYKVAKKQKTENKDLNWKSITWRKEGIVRCLTSSLKPWYATQTQQHQLTIYIIQCRLT